MADLILVDTREKANAIDGILRYFDDHNYMYDRTKLYFGDYMDYHLPETVVDRKQSIAELAMNCTSDHERFKRELERVKKAGAQLVVLVEQNRYKDRDNWIRVESIEDLLLWSVTHLTKDGREVTITGEKLYRILASWCAKYPLTVEFCDKRETGRRITEILYKRK